VWENAASTGGSTRSGPGARNTEAAATSWTGLKPTKETRMSNVGRCPVPDNSQSPRGGGWQPVVKYAITAGAVTLTAILTDSLDMAALVGTVLHGR
jgi:hypothetical protein